MKSMAQWHFVHKYITFLSFTEMGVAMGTVIYRDGWGWRHLFAGLMGTGTISKLVVGIRVAMGIRVVGTVRDGYKYLSPCSYLVYT